MEKFEGENNLNKEEKKGVSRRDFLKILGVAGAGVFFSDIKAFAQNFSEIPSKYEKHGWYYTLEEMKDVYKKEYNSKEKIFKNTIFKKENDIVGSFGKKEFLVPEKFVESVLSHLKEMLEQKAAKFIFRLDAFHGHVFVSNEEFSVLDSSLKEGDDIKAIEKNRITGILYHNSEHLKKGKSNLEEENLEKKRNVIGWMDDNRIEILPLPKGKSNAVSIPEGYHGWGKFFLKFAAHKDGEFSIDSNGEKINLDISFDDQSYY